MLIHLFHLSVWWFSFQNSHVYGPCSLVVTQSVWRRKCFGIVLYNISVIQCWFSFQQMSMHNNTPSTGSIINILCSTLNKTIKHNGSLSKTGLRFKQISAHLIPNSVPLEQFTSLARIVDWSWSIAILLLLFLFFSFLARFDCSFCPYLFCMLCQLDGTTTFWFFIFFSITTASYCVILFTFRSYHPQLMINAGLLSPLVH